MKQLFGNPTTPLWKSGPSDWYESIGEEMNVTWGLIDRFRWELPELRFMRGQTIWLEGTLDDLRERRKAVLGMARSIIGDSLDGELDALWPMIAIDTVSPRIANAICHAYNNPPVRTFSDDAGVDEGFDSLYDELEINSVMNAAYRAALFVNTVFLYWDGKCFKILTPEYFRLVEDKDGDPELWIARRETSGIVFDVWNNELHAVRSGGNGSVNSSEPNPYKRLPGVLMQLKKSNDTYGAGITECADLNAATNLIELFADRVALYQGFSVGIASNFGDSIKAGQRIAPGKILTPNNVGSDASTVPDFKYATPDGKFNELRKFKQDRIDSFQRNQDLPGFLVDASGVPPTGVALQVASQQINARRKADQESLRNVERALADFVSMIAKTFLQRPLLVANKFGIQYADPQTFDDPLLAWQYDVQLAQSGMTYPSAFYQKYYGIKKGITDEDAVKEMTANKAMFSFLTPPPPAATEALTKPSE